MDPDVAAPVIRRFDGVRDGLNNAIVHVVGHASSVRRACGELADAVDDDADAYHISWRSSLGVASTSAGIITGNTNVFEIELTRLDQTITVPDISPRSGGHQP